MQALVETGEYRKALGREGLQARYRDLYRGEVLKVIKPLRKPSDEITSLTDITEKATQRQAKGCMPLGADEMG